MVSFMSALLLTTVLSASMAYRNVLGKDIARTRLNQNLRGSLDIVGIDARVAGENLPSTFPAVELVNGTGSNPDTLTARRNLLNEVLPVCLTINAGTSTSQIYFAVTGNVAGCVYSGQTANYNAWRNYRISQGGTTTGFIYNTTTKLGEFFTFASETDTGTQYFLTRSGGGAWANSYPLGGAAIYILEEWQYRMQSGTLQLVQNRDTTNPFNVAFDMTQFQVSISMQDGTTRTSFTTADNWTQITALVASLTGDERYNGQVISRTLSSSFFPRNILSN